MLFFMLRKQVEDRIFIGRTNTTFSNKACDQTGRRNIKTKIARITFLWGDQYFLYPILSKYIIIYYFVSISLLDWNLFYSICYIPVESGSRQRNIKRNIVIFCSNCF